VITFYPQRNPTLEFYHPLAPQHIVGIITIDIETRDEFELCWRQRPDPDDPNPRHSNFYERVFRDQNLFGFNGNAE
jgi:hypothetical protein